MHQLIYTVRRLPGGGVQLLWGDGRVFFGDSLRDCLRRVLLAPPVAMEPPPPEVEITTE